MPQAVIDTSALIEVLTGKDPDIELRQRVLLGDLAAVLPDLWYDDALPLPKNVNA